MLRPDVSQFLIKFSERLEEKEVVSSESAAKIRKHIRSEESPSHWNLFLLIGGMLGAIIFSAGVFSIISHNWYDFPFWLRGVFGFVPVAIALYFYYRMLTKHGKSVVWIEATSLFLMLMIGASIAITTQTYHMSGDYEDFILVMLVATIPLFYIKRASAIALFYLGLSLLYLFLDFHIGVSRNSYVEFGDNSVWFWVFVLALLPHYYMCLNQEKKEQGIRFMFLTLILYVSMYWALMISIDSNRLLWLLTYNIGFYLFAKRYMGDHYWFLFRFMSWLPQIVIALTLVVVSNRYFMMNAFHYDSFFRMDDWSGGQWYYFLLLMVVMAGVYYNYFRSKEHYENSNHLIIFSPGLIFLLMLVDYFIDSWWILSLLINLYIICIAIVTMVSGSEEGRYVKLLSGMFLIVILVVFRYFDMSMGFIWKGLFFMFFGGIFFLITMFMKEKVDQIARNKKRIDGK